MVVVVNASKKIEIAYDFNIKCVPYFQDYFIFNVH